jgi:hypothetical protein
VRPSRSAGRPHCAARRRNPASEQCAPHELGVCGIDGEDAFALAVGQHEIALLRLVAPLQLAYAVPLPEKCPESFVIGSQYKEVLDEEVSLFVPQKPNLRAKDVVERIHVRDARLDVRQQIIDRRYVPA